ncbi:MAG TPA: glycerate dehydrogenase [Lentisphaeria bacterium]|nr:MAG: glycerate dehydrogenase [Lentisphaerae bacterium GWF2_50_93]HCE44201.1 glycerate dehydrogenase [Lentisphaeria bacterium]
MKAIYLLNKSSYDMIYGTEERAELGRLLEFIHPQLDSKTVMDAPAEILSEVEVIVSGWGMASLDSAMLTRLPKIKLVLYGAGTVKGFVTPEMWARGVRVSSAWCANAVPVSEFTLAQILFSLKHGWRAAAETKAGRGKRPQLQPPGAYGSTVGLLSLGMIGRMVLEKLRMFDLRVIAFDPFVTSAQGKEMGVEILSLAEVFRQSDVVSCHTPWLKETENMLRREHFELMKPGATFINTARGAVVDESGMIEVLKVRPDIYAVLDVTHPEPPVPESPLYNLPNVVLTPHIAGSMAGECHRMGRYMIDEFKRYKKGEPFKYEVTREMVSRLA